jgi:hypothetical protein
MELRVNKQEGRSARWRRREVEEHAMADGGTDRMSSAHAKAEACFANLNALGSDQATYEPVAVGWRPECTETPRE